MKKKRYVQVGLGARARFFYEAIAGTYNETAELIGLCDINMTRMEYANRVLTENFGYPSLPKYRCDEFNKMIADLKPDYVLVTSIDRTHHKYIIRAMELGCDVITEKPMTTDEKKCQQILDAQKRTGRNLRVTFNYRYSPQRSLTRELIRDGVIGQVCQVHFEWNLNTSHGADYFRRWHRDKRNSGGLLVHKATHHFDLVNFWLDTKPTEVFSFGDLMFYGRENAENRGITKFYARAHGNEYAKEDPFALIMEGNENYENIYLKAEHEDGYYRDQSVFGDGISIEDVMNVLVKYENGAIMCYSLNAFSPIEGYRVVFTGTKGRLEIEAYENIYVSGQGSTDKEGSSKIERITVFPMFGKSYDVEIPVGKGGHGGGDPVLLNDLFGTPKPDPLKRAASHIDGAMSILTGVAANKSISKCLPVKISELVKF